MIRVTIFKQPEQQRITGFQVEGHALFAEAGKDIVCSAVSAVTVGTVNAAEALLNVHMRTEMRDGFLHATLPETKPDADEKIQLILESMTVMLQSIEASYGEYIRIEHQIKRR